MASTLYLQIPPRTVADGLGAWSEQSFSYCLASSDKNILQQGRQSFSQLRDLVPHAERLVLLISASDVHFVQVAVPPMPFAKLKMALPNLLEEQLLSDSTDLFFVANPPIDGLCYVAVMGRTWIEQILGLATQLGATRVAAFALSDGLSVQPEMTTVLIESMHLDRPVYEIATKNEKKIASGLSIDGRQFGSDQTKNTQQIYAAVSILAPQTDLQIYANAELVNDLRQLFSNASNEAQQVDITSIEWKHKIQGLSNRTMDLLAPLQLDGKNSVDWYKWRWSLSLITVMIVISLSALNWKWWSLKREANNIRDSIQATYQSAFPKEPASRDPIFQMQQKINAAKKLAGQSSNDDFLVLNAQFAQAWDQLVPAQGGATVVSVEYRERSLFVTPKNVGEVPVEQLRALLKERHLKLEVKDGLLKIFVDVGGV